MEATKFAFALRMNEEDAKMLEFLKSRLGMGTSQILRHAVRRLYQAESAAVKKESK
jgi:hypothetical protein